MVPGVQVSSAEVGDDNKVSVKLSNGDQVSFNHCCISISSDG